MQKIPKLLEDAAQARVFSGFQFCAEKSPFSSEPIRMSVAGGQTSHWPEAKPVDSDTLFDLGSLTKVIVTTSCVARGVQAGVLSLDAEVSDYVAELGSNKVGRLSLKYLLNHSSGLHWWAPYYEASEPSLVEWFQANEDNLLKGEQGAQFEYSDLGFWLLGLVVQNAMGSLKDCFQNEVVKPLGLDGVIFAPVDGGSSVASTEFREKLDRPLRGEIFDENAEKVQRELSGAAPHAGLFSTAEALLPFAREWLKAVQGESSWLNQELAERFSKTTGWVSSSSWALGWDTKSPKGSSAGELFSSQSFGHLGFTGTSLWIDPNNEVLAIFLSNRVHPSREDERIRELRPKVHNALMEEWGVGG